MFVLLLLVFSGGTVALTSAEFSSRPSCEAAREKAIKTFGAAAGITKAYATCNEK